MTTIGIVAPRAVGDVAIQSGVDYVEPTIVGNVVHFDDDFKPSLNPEFVGELYPSFAVLLPGGLAVSDPAVPAVVTARYFDRLFPLLAQVAHPGAKVVFGSGAARTLRPGVSREEGEERFAQSVRQAVAAARASGLEVILEPLHRGETDLINSLSEAVAFLDAHGMEDVRVVADLFHIEMESEPLAVVVANINRIGHAHIADAGRKWVGSGSGGWREFVATLRESGYQGPISLECNWGDELAGEISRSVASLRDLG